MSRVVYDGTPIDYQPGDTLAMAALRAGLKPAYTEGVAPTVGALRLESPNGVTIAWEYVGAQPAAGLAQYSYVAPTGQDSIGAGSYDNTFEIEAMYNYSGVSWYSAAAAGHSVDNLPPVIPTPFTAAFKAGSTYLHWGANTEVDLAGYRLYRGTSSGFVPSDGNQILATTDTSAVDAAAGYWYKLAAVDAHGNISAFATLGPSNTLDAPGGAAVPRALAFALGSANPSHGAVSLRLDLPRATTARVALYDVRGRLVRELASGAREAGSYTLAWDGRDAAGAVAGDGVYFARLDAEGRTLTQRVVRMR